jgi:2-keto-4-pentenoate hydratase/2-oxohepta-3-ene-1,7-dioic acid hydratase in catechol pathway
MVTKDEIADIQQLDMWLDVNGVRRQTGNTRTMIFTCAQIVAHLSTLMTLHPGDVISTGTPPGVALGKGMDGDGYLEDGDVVEVWISGLGLQRQTVVADV